VVILHGENRITCTAFTCHTAAHNLTSIFVFRVRPSKISSYSGEKSIP